MTGGVSVELISKRDPAFSALVVRYGSTEQEVSTVRIGGTAGMMGGATLLHGALVAQRCVFPMKAVQREQRHFLRASRASVKTAICAADEEARTAGVSRWRRLT